MQHDSFDVSRWLARWKEAGGGWADRHLIRPRNSDGALAALTAELNDDRRQAILDHIGGRVTAPF